MQREAPINTSHTNKEAKTTTLKRKQKNSKPRASTNGREAIANRFCFSVFSNPNSPTQPEYKRYTDLDKKKRRALMDRGGMLEVQNRKQTCEYV